eukprot:CAMPEP_0170584030 /NCGR_PEP_ID=MMETSP0224-20130122/8471_1 /TAXON_ID=285029 /ORGANISM="Togula jolla, Strain CCCM 725" /LENGTH=93 /DNA_ID=CAMNT_0010907437 /DNA_START=73 /DNA_END=351 /DNA_ORIENTATION=+
MSCGQDVIRKVCRRVSFGSSSELKYVPDDGADDTKQVLTEHSAELADDEGPLSDLVAINERVDRKLRDRCAAAVVYSQALNGSVPAIASSKIW